MTAQASPPAGWYSDPSDASQQRYWDGRNWTSNTHPSSGSSSPFADNAEPATRMGSGPGFFPVLFDFKMQPDYIVTKSFARFLNTAVTLSIIATWAGLGGFGLFLGIYERDSVSVIIGFLILVIGWLPSLITIVATRVALDFVLDNMHGSQSTSLLVQQTRNRLDKTIDESSNPAPDETPSVHEEEVDH